LRIRTRRKPRRYLIVATRRLPAAVLCHKHLVVVPRPLFAAPILLLRAYLAVALRPVLRICVAGTCSWCSGRCLDHFMRRRDAAASGGEHLGDEQMKFSCLKREGGVGIPQDQQKQGKYYQLHVHRGKVRLAAMYLRNCGVVGRGFSRTYVIVLRPVPRPLPAATRSCRSRKRALGR
jgi:hypothetical protein